MSCGIALDFSNGPSVIIEPSDFGIIMPTTNFPGYPFAVRIYVGETEIYVVVNGNIVEASAVSIANINSNPDNMEFYPCAQIPPNYIDNVVLYTRLSPCPACA